MLLKEEDTESHHHQHPVPLSPQAKLTAWVLHCLQKLENLKITHKLMRQKKAKEAKSKQEQVTKSD